VQKHRKPPKKNKTSKHPKKVEHWPEKNVTRTDKIESNFFAKQITTPLSIRRHQAQTTIFKK
jgi:hypothetical protein